MAGSFLATAYGPPWNAMNGSGVTSTGIPLRGQVPVIAVDPRVIPYGSIVRASNSPLGPNKLFVAGDTGGAIRGNHIDFYVAGGRGPQMNWGQQQIQLQVVKPGSGPGSVRSALASLGGMGGGSVPSAPSAQPAAGGGMTSVTVPQTVQSFDQAGYNAAEAKFIAGSALKEANSSANPYNTVPGTSKGLNASIGSPSGALFARGLLTTTAPNPGDFTSTQTVNHVYQLAQNNLQKLAGNAPLSVHPGASGIAGGFLPAGARYVPGRKDQGRDGQTNPGGPIIANGNGVVVNVLSDPNGFGPRYPVVHFTSGPYAGQTIYFGHTLATVQPGQQVRPGQVLSHTGTSGVGNATVPGWFEIGFAPGGSPGRMGQPTPF